MSDYILAIILLLFALAGVVIYKAYFALPVRELKRRAEEQDGTAARLYRAAVFESSLKGLLWLYVGFTGGAGLVLLAVELPFWISVVLVGPLLSAICWWLLSSKTKSVETRLAVMAAPGLAWLLNYLHPVLNRGAETIKRHHRPSNHTGLYERDDLVKLVEQQKHQPDNRVSEEELEIARRALAFSDYKVGDLLIPRKQIKTVLADDTVGPVLIDEIHKSGKSSVLVKDGKKGPVIGSLSLARLNLESKGAVRDIMDSTVYYLNEDDSLSEALHAFFVTNHPLFVVVNNFEEYVGIITVESIVKHLLGHVPGDDFDQYSNLAAVARRRPKQLEETPAVDESPESEDEIDETPVKTDDEVIE